MDNRTIIKPSAPPKYQINETVYLRISATKGYVEPIFIHSVRFEPSNRMYIYRAREDRVIHRIIRLIPTEFKESQLINLQDALTIQISVLEGDYNIAISKFSQMCPNGVVPYKRIVSYEDFRGQLTPPIPRFGYNEVVYIKETASAVGRLEAMRVTDMKWDNQSKMWIYSFEFKPRPEYNMAVGDADLYRRAPTINYYENELCVYCEAQQAVIIFLTEALTRARNRLAAYSRSDITSVSNI